MMNAAVFIEPGRIEVVSKPMPDVGPNDGSIGTWAVGLGNHKINTSLCLGGKERMRLMNIVASGRLELGSVAFTAQQPAIAHD